jgi:hypothetical protein
MTWTRGKVDFDKILAVVGNHLMEHPDPFVRKWPCIDASRIVKAHMSAKTGQPLGEPLTVPSTEEENEEAAPESSIHICVHPPSRSHRIL